MTDMTEHAWRQFVAEGRRLGNAAIARADGRPHVTPICFFLEADSIVFITHPGSVKGKSLARDAQIAICVTDETYPYRFVLLEGKAAISADEEEFRQEAAKIARRYYPDQETDAFVDTMANAGFIAARTTIERVIARQDLG